MSGGLPLEVIGLISPVLYWVEGGENPGLPDSWRGENFSFLDRIKSWLMRELPTYSYDSLDEIIKLSLGEKCFRQVNRKYGKQHGIMAPLENVDLAHIFRKYPGIILIGGEMHCVCGKGAWWNSMNWPSVFLSVTSFVTVMRKLWSVVISPGTVPGNYRRE